MNEDTKGALRVTVTISIIIAAIMGLVALLVAVSPLLIGTQLYSVYRFGAPFWTYLVWTVLGALGLFVLGFSLMSRAQAASNTTKAAVGYVTGGTAVVVAIVLLGSFVVRGTPQHDVLTRNGYDSRRAYVENLTEQVGGMPTYQRRLNFAQAKNILASNLEDAAVQSTTEPRYSVVNGEAAWCVAGRGPGDTLGRQWTRSVICLKDDGESIVTARFEGRVKTLGGNFSSNLAKAVARLRRGLQIDGGDLRFGIKHNKPFAVVPVTQVGGSYEHPITVPAGVVTIGPKGQLAYHREVARGELPVPVISTAIAEQIRGALNTRSGLWCQERLMNDACRTRNIPLEDTTSIGGTEDAATDPNAGNASEFVLRTDSGRLVMVTPLTRWGQGRNVVAYLSVPVDEVKAGHIPAATLYKVKPQVAYSRIAQVITATYAKALGYTGEDSARKIYEITPSAPGQAVATIGTPENPEYSVVIETERAKKSLDFRFCVQNYRTQIQIECRQATGGVAPQDALERGAAVNPSGDTTGTTTSGADLSQVPTSELIAELSRRYPQGQ